MPNLSLVPPVEPLPYWDAAVILRDCKGVTAEFISEQARTHPRESAMWTAIARAMEAMASPSSAPAA